MKFTCLQSQRAHNGHNLLVIGDDRHKFLWLFFNRSKGKEKTDAFVIINSTFIAPLSNFQFIQCTKVFWFMQNAVPKIFNFPVQFFARLASIENLLIVFVAETMKLLGIGSCD